MYLTSTKLHKKNELIWNYISNVINIRGYESTTSEDLRESSIKSKLASGKQIIWLCKRYKLIGGQETKGDLVGTYTLHCREYTKNNFICTGFIGNNEIEIQIPINKTTPKYQIYLSALGEDYICEYVKTLII